MGVCSTGLPRAGAFTRAAAEAPCGSICSGVDLVAREQPPKRCLVQIDTIMKHVLYLTGPPASGKSTLSRELQKRLPDLLIFEYGAQLTERLSRQSSTPLLQTDLRQQSSAIATAEDIVALDRELLEFVAMHRSTKPIVIDSHAVTKEEYGFRITAYSLDEIKRLAPTIIVCLYTSPAITVQRIESDAGGRRSVTEWEAGFHTALQASVAIDYATAVGAPVYLFDGTKSTADLADGIQRLLQKPTRDTAF